MKLLLDMNPQNVTASVYTKPDRSVWKREGKN